MTKITVTITGDVADYIKAVAKEKGITVEASTQRCCSIGMNRDRALNKYQGPGSARKTKAKAAKKTATKKVVAKAAGKKVAKSGPKKKSRVAKAKAPKAEAPSNGISDGLDLSDVN